jgi:hypothetical protein
MWHPLTYLILFFALPFASTKESFGWGHIRELNNPDQVKNYLIYPLIKYKKIFYCTEIEDPQSFNPKSISDQMDYALRLWINHLSNLNPKHFKSKKFLVRTHPKVNLKIKIFNDASSSDAAYQEISQIGKKPISLIVINTAFRDSAQKGAFDFKDIAGEMDVMSALEWAQTKKLTKETYLKKSRYQNESGSFSISSSQMIHCSYLRMLHELGHSFGLSDTYLPNRLSDLDPVYKSQRHPYSVMKNASSFYLSSDDITGMRTLYKRFKPSFSDETSPMDVDP